MFGPNPTVAEMVFLLIFFSLIGFGFWKLVFWLLSFVSVSIG